MATASDINVADASKNDGKLSFSNWKYSHYFTLVSTDKNNISVKCNLCSGSRALSAARNSNSNLAKHLEKRHASTKLEAKPSTVSIASDDAIERTPGPSAPKQQRLEFLKHKTYTQGQVDKKVARYVVERMLPISTVEEPSFRDIISMAPITGGGAPRQMTRRNFSNYLEKEYAKMEEDLKESFHELTYVSTTADIWTHQNRSYLGVTAHWINPTTLKREKAALACRRFRGSHTYDSIAYEIDHIHALYGLSKKVTYTVTDNGSNFVKAFKTYQPPPDEDSDASDTGDEDDEATFTDVYTVLEATTEEGVILPPHLRCASHTMNLVSCSDLEKWLSLNSTLKTVYRSSIAKCTALWNRASRSTVAGENVEELFGKKLKVPCTTRWNSFHDSVARVVEIPRNDLTTICDKLSVSNFRDKELTFLKEYVTVTKPLTIALDILQGEDTCYYGTLLPTLEVLLSKTLATKDGLTVAMGLPDAIVASIRTRFASVFQSEDAMVAAATLPCFKLKWCKDAEKKEAVKNSLVAACHKVTPLPGALPLTPRPTPTTPPTPSNSSAQAFFNFEEEDDTFSSVESEILSYLRTPEMEMDVLQRFPLIKEVSLQKNCATPSSAPVERLFSLGGLVLCPKRNKLKDNKFEQLLLLRYNHKFER